MKGNVAENTAEYVTLNTGDRMPKVGLGVCLAGEDTAASVREAIRQGYRLIDTAKAYGNEKDVGEGIRQSGIPREEIFVTTKLSVPDMEKGNVRGAFERSLEQLQMDYVDLYLLHWPVVEQIRESWLILEELYRKGLIRNIGVSNFQIHHLREMESYQSVVPAVNQIECHPLLVQKELRQYCSDKGIVNEAWSPIGRGLIFEEEVLKDLAEKYEKTAAQIVLRWHIQNNTVVIPKSTKLSRIIENHQIFDFALSEEDMGLIDAMDQNHRFGSDPDNFHFDV